MPTIARPGARVAYTVTGSGPPVILGHSLFCTRAMWAGVLERLGDAYTIINVELRGHGESTATAPFTLWDLVDDWAAILDAEGLRSAVCGGLSTGGFTAMRMALKMPARVRGLVLLDTDAGAESRIAQRLQYELLGWVYRSTGFVPVTILARAMFGAETRAQHPERLAEFIRVLRTFDRRHLHHAMRAVFGRDSVDLSAVRKPTLVATGEDDQATPVARARRIAAQIAGARLHTIPGAGHLSAVERPDVVAALLRDFLPRCFQDGTSA
jgi:pimeloyl-ACP methyl ester carboxylesterase